MTIRIAPSSDQPLRIAMWSGPRNISTAMMRSFSSRADCAVTDEPFYGAFLKQSGERQPMAEAVIADMETDWHSVADSMRGPVPGGKAVWYQKHMPHHMIGPVDILDFPDHAHVFLIRAPELVVASYAAKNELRAAHLLGFAQQVEYHKRISDRLGKAAPVLDSNDILANPAVMLAGLCAAIGIDWDPAMLNWPAGAHPADGIWGSHWYNAVEKSTGFGAPTVRVPLSDAAQRIADQCQADYAYLARFRIRSEA
jgi:Sulfotransferase domain